ncbi:hypothetical protein Gohar_025566 [Gossypium harknessii]|uniref:Uncharacterized protein n=1 Tax=Gossypium harknessii TaxID=34285 RepID=A0A7J9IA10_9ROSI|nr:hypothetical protein [Gossypium harknessii]
MVRSLMLLFSEIGERVCIGLGSFNTKV